MCPIFCIVQIKQCDVTPSTLYSQTVAPDEVVNLNRFRVVILSGICICYSIQSKASIDNLNKQSSIHPSGIYPHIFWCFQRFRGESYQNASQRYHSCPLSYPEIKQFYLQKFFNNKYDYFSESSFGGYENTSSSGVIKTRAIRKASSRVGEYFPFSMATIVCRVTPTLSANSCWVISSAIKRNFRISFFTKHFPILIPPCDNNIFLPWPRLIHLKSMKRSVSQTIPMVACQ